MQWTAGVSSSRLRQTVQNLLLWCVGSDQQCATGFLIMQGAIPEQGVTTLVTHLSWTIKLQTEFERRKQKIQFNEMLQLTVAIAICLFIDVNWIHLSFMETVMNKYMTSKHRSMCNVQHPVHSTDMVILSFHEIYVAQNASVHFVLVSDGLWRCSIAVTFTSTSASCGGIGGVPYAPTNHQPSQPISRHYVCAINTDSINTLIINEWMRNCNDCLLLYL